MSAPKNLFYTKVFQAALLTLVSSIAPVAISCQYEHRYPTEQEEVAISGLLLTFAFTLIGRVQPAAYTPDGLPGPKQRDLEGQSRQTENQSDVPGPTQ